MMQESGGRGNDPMQASECPYNTEYANTPGGITDPEYSINVGIQYLASCLAEAEVESPIDMEHIKLAIQDITTETDIFHGQKRIMAGTALPMPATFLI